MTLDQRIHHDMITAMKNHEADRLRVLRLLRSSIQRFEIDQKKKAEEKDIQIIIQKEIKKRGDAIREFEKARRNDLIALEKKEKEILHGYALPQLTDEALHAIIQDEISKAGALSVKDYGFVMGRVMARVRGQCDGRVVAEMVKEHLHNRDAAGKQS